MDKKGYKIDRLSTAGLLGIGTIALFELLAHKPLTVPLKISLFSFSIAMPLLSGYYFLLESASHHEQTVKHWFISVAGFGGMGAAFIGIAAVIGHLSWIASIIFIIFSLFTIAGFNKVDGNIEWKATLNFLDDIKNIESKA